MFLSLVFHRYFSPGAPDGQSVGCAAVVDFQAISFLILVRSGGAAAPSAPLLPAGMVEIIQGFCK